MGHDLVYAWPRPSPLSHSLPLPRVALDGQPSLRDADNGLGKRIGGGRIGSGRPGGVRIGGGGGGGGPGFGGPQMGGPIAVVGRRRRRAF